MKKILSLILTSFLAISLSACGNSASIKSSTSSPEESDNEQAKTITIKDFNGEIEVPYNPQKIAVLDLAALDIIDALESVSYTHLCYTAPPYYSNFHFIFIHIQIHNITPNFLIIIMLVFLFLYILSLLLTKLHM